MSPAVVVVPLVTPRGSASSVINLSGKDNILPYTTCLFTYNIIHKTYVVKVLGIQDQNETRHLSQNNLLIKIIGKEEIGIYIYIDFGFKSIIQFLLR